MKKQRWKVQNAYQWESNLCCPFISALYFTATKLTQVFFGVCQAPRCQRPEEAEEKTNKIWTLEVWDEARLDQAVGHHSPNNSENNEHATVGPPSVWEEKCCFCSQYGLWDIIWAAVIAKFKWILLIQMHFGTHLEQFCWHNPRMQSPLMYHFFTSLKQYTRNGAQEISMSCSILY